MPFWSKAKKQETTVSFVLEVQSRDSNPDKDAWYPSTMNVSSEEDAIKEARRREADNRRNRYYAFEVTVFNNNMSRRQIYPAK